MNGDVRVAQGQLVIRFSNGQYPVPRRLYLMAG